VKLLDGLESISSSTTSTVFISYVHSSIDTVVVTMNSVIVHKLVNIPASLTPVVCNNASCSCTRNVSNPLLQLKHMSVKCVRVYFSQLFFVSMNHLLSLLGRHPR